MIDFRLSECPSEIRKIYPKIVRICDSEYFDGYVVGVLTTKGGANGILVYKNPKFEWLDGVSFYNSQRNGNYVCDSDSELDSDMERQIRLRAEFGEGNYKWYKF